MQFIEGVAFQIPPYQHFNGTSFLQHYHRRHGLKHNNENVKSNKQPDTFQRLIGYEIVDSIPLEQREDDVDERSDSHSDRDDKEHFFMPPDVREYLFQPEKGELHVVSIVGGIILHALPSSVIADCAS